MKPTDKPRRGLEARIKPGESIKLREGIQLTNLGNQTFSDDTGKKRRKTE
jgi:hypothetical protein